jgi:acyl-CoA thioester hydrolase
VIPATAAVLEVKNKTLRFAHRMLDATTGEVCAVTQVIAAHLDTEARRAVAPPEAVAAKARALQVAMPLPWDR